MGRKRQRTEEASDRQRKTLLVPAILLLLLGLASSAYLVHLYVKVRSAGGGPVDSFCAVSDVMNCVTVANSSYSTFLGLPTALYAFEFFAVELVILILSATRAWRFRAWDSILFDGVILSLPVCVALAWISARIIRSFCLVCTVLYAVSLVLFLMLLVVGRKRVGALLLDGPRELLRLCPRAPWLVGLVLFFGAAFSQLVFAPGLFRIRSEQPASGGAWSGLPTAGQTIGPPDAPLKIEEFTDFQCPHCGNAHTVMMEVLRRFPGKIHLVHRDFPLDLACNPMVKHPMHPHACEAARYARCAAQQGKYWPYEELLFENREQLGEGNLKALARRVGLDLDRLERCVRDPRTEQAVLDDINEGLRRKLGGTPTLFVNGEMMVGMRPLPYWEARIKRLSSR